MRVSTEIKNRLTIIPENQSDTDFLMQLGLHPESSPLIRLACSSPHLFNIGEEDTWFLVDIRKENIIAKSKPETED